MLEVKNLHKHYGSFEAVRGISFEVQSGEVMGFLGPNGAGKTTTMKIVVGYMAMTAGEVKVDGLDVERSSRAVRERIGYLPENAPLYEDMTVLEYLRFMSRMRGLGGRRRQERLDHVVGVCALGPKKKAIIGTLSKGYRQRVGLAQAIIHEPKLVILDEPTVGLDPNQIVEIREVLREIGEKNTVILSSHILSEVEATCGRVVIIAAGEIAAKGTIEELETRQSERLRYSLRVDAAPADLAARLAALPDVDDVVAPDTDAAGTWRFAAPKGEPFAGALQNLARDGGFVVLELTSSKPTLEDVFRDLTADRHPRAAVGAANPVHQAAAGERS